MHMTTHSKFALQSSRYVACAWPFSAGAAQRHDVDIAVVVHPDTPISNLSLC